MAEPTGPSMLTFTGRPFWPESPRVEDVHIEDIAHALSMICRFGGHTRVFYSVAQHSVLVAQALGVEGFSALEQLAGLLHDASEAYLGDVVWPVKHTAAMRGYHDLEARCEAVVADAFGLPHPLPSIVKHFDLVLLATEKRDLTCSPEASVLLEAAGRADAIAIQPRPYKIRGWAPHEAEAAFLDLFHCLIADVVREAPTKTTPRPGTSGSGAAPSA